jgi:hypothetical protein
MSRGFKIGGFRTERRDAKRFKSPDGVIATAKEHGKERGISGASFRRRVIRWGLGDPRTWMTAEEAQAEAYRVRSFSRSDSEIYQSPCGQYQGTASEIVKTLGTKRQNFLAKKRRFGDEDLRVWMNCWQAETYRLYRVCYKKGIDCSKYEGRLLRLYRESDMDVFMVGGVPVLKG